ncbi:MAG TPA: GNAT family N-acetyltransferase [Longimicrobiales bacterium]|nr:GNAT family N-acetyltransferase [Longimicrobiales bacterium]
MTLAVVRYPTAGALLERAEPWLLRAEDSNNLLLSLCYAVAEEEAETPPGPIAAGSSAPFFATVEEAGSVAGCAFRTPPHQVLLTEMPLEGPVALARQVAEVYPVIPAVLGPPDLAEAFAREWTSLTGTPSKPGTDQRLYRLDEVTPLDAPGRMRLARPEEVALAASWAEAFAREVHTRFGPGEEAISAWIHRGYVFFWEDAGEAGFGPVSMAVAHGRTPHGARIGYVYTPPGRRRRGYAGALVAELSQRLLDCGMAFCVLYADLSNPTTNALYQKMGYRSSSDVRDYHFDPEAP